MVQFYPWFWGMVMYGNEFETEENIIEPQHLLVVLHLQFVTSSLFIDVFVKLNGQFFSRSVNNETCCIFILSLLGQPLLTLPRC